MNVQFNYNTNDSSKVFRFYSKEISDFIKFSKGDFVWAGAFENTIKSGDLQCEDENQILGDYDELSGLGTIVDIYHDCTFDTGEYLLILELEQE